MSTPSGTFLAERPLAKIRNRGTGDRFELEKFFAEPLFKAVALKALYTRAHARADELMSR